MRNEAVDGTSDDTWGRSGVEESRPGAARVARRRAAGPRPVRPAAAAPAVRPVQPMRPAGRALPVAVVVPLFGGPARERVVARFGVAPAFQGCPPEAVERGGVRGAAPAEAARRFLAGLALMVAVAIAVVLLGLVAAAAGEARGGASGEPASTVMVSPDGAAATR